MTDKKIFEKLEAEIERLENYENESVTSSDTRFGWIHGKTFALTSIRVLLDSMQKEPKECMYSTANYTDEDRKALCDGCEEECEFNKKEESINNGIDLGCGVIWKDEEPASKIDFEQELYKYFGQVKDFTLGMRIAKRFYEIGRKYQEPASADLEQAVDNYLVTYFGSEQEKQNWPFLKKMAIHFAKWQEAKDQEVIETAIHHAYHNGRLEMKEQLMAKAFDGAFIRRNRYTKKNVLNGFDTTCDAIQGFKDKDKIKVIFVKED